jgi:hypothetical protein
MVPKYVSGWRRLLIGRKCDVLARDAVADAKCRDIRGGLTDSATFWKDRPRLVFVLIGMVRPDEDSVTCH